MWPVSVQTFDESQSHADKLILMQLGWDPEYLAIDGTNTVAAIKKSHKILHGKLICYIRARIMYLKHCITCVGLIECKTAFFKQSTIFHFNSVATRS